MSQFPDIMVDIETTGTDPSRTNMIQLAAVRFNIETGAVDPAFFLIQLKPTYGRFWDESTRAWWYKDKAEILKDILAKGIPAKPAMEAFQKWIVQGFGEKPYRFWSKPQSFDWNFVDSYFQQFEMANPMSFREAVDMRTWCRARLNNWNMRDLEQIEKAIPFDGPAHNALYDALHQVKIVLAVRHMTETKAAA